MYLIWKKAVNGNTTSVMYSLHHTTPWMYHITSLMCRLHTSQHIILNVCWLKEETVPWFEQWPNTEIAPHFINVVTQCRNSLLWALKENYVSCGRVALWRDYTITVKSLTVRKAFIQNKHTFQWSEYKNCSWNQLLLGHCVRFHSIQMLVVQCSFRQCELR